jgi:hypothetical protein
MDIWSIFWNTSQNTPVWWALVIFGSLVGYIVGAIPRLIRLLIVSFKSHSIEIAGRWIAYVYTFKEHYVCQAYDCDVSRTRLGDLQIDVCDYQSKESLYNGTISEEGYDYIFELRSTKQTETAYIRFKGHVGHADYLYGLWLSYDHDKHLACGIVILSREALTPEQRKDKIISHYNHSAGCETIRLN